MAQPNPTPGTDGRAAVETDEGCPGCGAMFADGWADRVDADAQVFRANDGTVVAQITFDCPNCDTPLLMEDATSAVMGVDHDRA